MMKYLPLGILLLTAGQAECFFSSAIPGCMLSYPRFPALSHQSPMIASGARRPAAHLATRFRAAADGPAAPKSFDLDSPVAALMVDCKAFGMTRFVTVNPAGMVLESAADMKNLSMSGFEVPGKGKYVTIASPDKMFEAHINMDKVKQVTFSQDPAKVGGHTLYVMRLKGEDGAIMASIMLQYDVTKGPGQYHAGAVEAFQSVESKYGKEFNL